MKDQALRLPSHFFPSYIAPSFGSRAPAAASFSLQWPVISFGFLVSRPSGIYLGAAKSSISTAIWPTSIRGPVLSYGQFRDRRCQTPRRRCPVLADRVIGVALDPSLSPLLLALRAHIRRFYATLTATAMGSPTGSKRSSRSDSVAGAAPRSSPVNKSSPAGLSGEPLLWFSRGIYASILIDVVKPLRGCLLSYSYCGWQVIDKGPVRQSEAPG